MKKNIEDYYYDDIDDNNDDMINLLDKYDSIEKKQKSILKEDSPEIDIEEEKEVKDLEEIKKPKKRRGKKEKNKEPIDEEIEVKVNDEDDINETKLSIDEDSLDDDISKNKQLDDLGEAKLITDEDDKNSNFTEYEQEDDISEVKLTTNDKDSVVNEDLNNEDDKSNDFTENEQEDDINEVKLTIDDENNVINEEEVESDKILDATTSSDKDDLFKKDETIEVKKKKSELPEILVSLASIGTIGYYIYYVMHAINDVNYVFKIANASLIIIALLCAVSAFISKNKSKKRDFMTILVSIILVTFLVFNLLVNNKVIKLPTRPVLKDYTNLALIKVLNFANDNEIELKQSYEYSDNVKDGYIISQSVKPDTIVKTIKKMSVVVSSGPNYDKELILTDFTGLKVNDAIKFVRKNHMNNVNMDFEVNEGVEKDVIISQSTKGEIKRNTQVDFKVSLGNAADLPELNIKDLTNMTLFEATLYLKRNGINYTLKYEFNKKVKKDHIISQDKKPNTKVKPGTDSVELTVSYGKEIKVPDFAGKTSEDVVNWASKNNLKVAFEEKYHVSVKKGNLISINYQAGVSICEGTKIIILTSLGPVIVPEFPNLAALRTWAAENKVNVSESYQYSTSIAKGNIIRVNLNKGSKIDPEKDSIIVEISQGTPITIPSFIGKSKSNIQSQCRSLSLNCSFYYVGFNNNPADTAVNQNVRSGLQVVSGTYVSIGLSNGPAQTYKVYIDDTYFTVGNSDSSIQSLKSRLSQTAPGVTFNITKHAATSGTSGMIHPNSPVKGGQWNYFTQGITYNIWVII